MAIDPILMRRLASAAVAGLDKSYDLVYVVQGDRLTKEQVEAVVENDFEKLYDLLSEWESDQVGESSRQIARDAVKEVISEWERADGREYPDLLEDFQETIGWDELIAAIEERESGDWLRQLVGATPRQLLRIRVLDEDHGYSHQEVAPERVLADVGLPVTPGNVKIMADTLAECSPQFSTLLGYWVVSAYVEQLYNLGDCTQVTIKNPHLYLGNPLAGSGFISEEPFEGMVTVERSALRTDAKAFGYSVNDIYGGLNVSEYEADIAPVVTPVADIDREKTEQS